MEPGGPRRSSPRPRNGDVTGPTNAEVARRAPNQRRADRGVIYDVTDGTLRALS
jgi:hypothetical protein